MTTCTCGRTARAIELIDAAAWHMDDCPRYLNQCMYCDGYGTVSVLGATGKYHSELCLCCKGTGNERQNPEEAK